MYVSSFNTYVQTESSKKATAQKSNTEQSSSFAKLTQKNLPEQSTALRNLPIDYISKNEGFFTRLKAQEYNAELEKSTKKFSDSKTLKSAKSAYESNTRLYFSSQKAEITLAQTPQYESQDTNLRQKIVNTYIQNDKYYQITA